MNNLSIVTSCGGYWRYLGPWMESILALTQKPAFVGIFTHGSPDDREAGDAVALALIMAGINARHEHSVAGLDFGTARNRAVAMTSTEWVMHLDCDDRIMPHALEDIAALAPDADVVSLGYERAGELKLRPINKTRIYRDGTGLEILTHAAPCSGVSPFRRTLWEQSPYRTDMRGAWDTALWIGFARLGARFRATKRPCFWYWHHPDSIYTRRRTTVDWTRAIVQAQLGALRRNDRGVAIIVPRSHHDAADRVRAWQYVRAQLAARHPDWPIVEGFCDAKTWCKADAVADALSRTTADVLVVADADCLVEASALEWAVAQVQCGTAWAIPHRLVYRLAQSVTDSYLATGATITTEALFLAPLARAPYDGFAGGGMFVVRRVNYEATGGIPRAFRGWGGEDEALATILDTLIGPHVRGTAPLIHLWHVAQPTKRLSSVNNVLALRVKRAAHAGPQVLLKYLHGIPKPAVVPAKPKVLHGVGLEDRQPYLARTRGTR